MRRIRLATANLSLVPATGSLLAAELRGREVLAEQLAADVPADWPPEHYDRRAVAQAAGFLARHPDGVGWTVWYLLLREAQGRGVVAGICGFKGWPSEDGTVEIGYSVVASRQRRGIATEAVGALVAWALSHADVHRVVAETYPTHVASIRVVEANGFRHVGPGANEGVIRYQREK